METWQTTSSDIVFTKCFSPFFKNALDIWAKDDKIKAKWRLQKYRWIDKNPNIYFYLAYLGDFPYSSVLDFFAELPQMLLVMG